MVYNYNVSKKVATTKAVNPLFSFRINGAEGQNRTADTGIFRRIFVKTEKTVITTK